MGLTETKPDDYTINSDTLSDKIRKNMLYKSSKRAKK